jgi:NTP pyrophosphatase (non-canonical NTP hydrolase)
VSARSLNDLWTSNLALRRRFPDGIAPFKIIARLAEECGELSAEVQLWEGMGVKREKHGPPDRARLAKEVMDVLRAALAVAEYYGIEDDLAAALDRSLAGAVGSGLLTPAEAAEPIAGRR